MNEPTLLLYDASCRFCDMSSKTVLQLLPIGTIERADVNDSLIQQRYGISREAAQREMYLVNRRGQVTHGIWAVGELLRLSRWAWPLGWLWQIPGFTYIGQKIYLWIADHRYMIMGRVYKDEESIKEGGACKDGACAIHLGRMRAEKESTANGKSDRV